MKRKEEKNKKTKERDQRAVEITREPLRFTHQKTVFFSFFLFPIFSCYLLTLEKDRREEKKGSPLSLSLYLCWRMIITCCAD